MKPQTSERVARGLVGAARACHRFLPRPLREQLDQRFFYAVFQVSRVTNDHYPAPPTHKP